MGDLEYVRQACRLARKYGPEDVKLFINDYNLEGTWDLTTKDGIRASKKLWALVNWIKKWEADGVTKIDGIGTQMHISFNKSTNAQNNLKTAITGMFQLMAKSGKLVRVSEMDMGYNDANGKSVPTSKMTETQHKEMANFYEWIIKEYFRIIPAIRPWVSGTSTTIASTCMPVSFADCMAASRRLSRASRLMSASTPRRASTTSTACACRQLRSMNYPQAFTSLTARR